MPTKPLPPPTLGQIRKDSAARVAVVQLQIAIDGEGLEGGDERGSKPFRCPLPNSGAGSLLLNALSRHGYHFLQAIIMTQNIFNAP